MSALYPYGWWGLLGLLIPILIHLLSKKEKSIVHFGSLRFLQPLESDSAKSIQLSQYLLLFLRLLLLSLICLLLVSPFYIKNEKSTSYWIEDSIYRNADYAQFLQQIPKDQQVNIFSDQVTDSVGLQFYQSGWTLIDHLNRQHDSTIVYTHSFQKNLLGRPVVIASHIDWKIIPFKDKKSAAQILYDGKESIQWTVSSTKDEVTVERQKVESNISSMVKKLKIRLIHNGFDKEATQIRKIVELSQEHLFYKIEWLSIDQEEKADWSIIIDQEGVKNNGHAIIWTPSNRALIVNFDGAKTISIDGHINKESIIDTNLPIVIASQFNKYVTSISTYDKRVINPKSITFNNETDKMQYSNVKGDNNLKNKRPLQSLVLLFMVPVFFAERFLNYKNSKEA